MKALLASLVTHVRHVLPAAVITMTVCSCQSPKLNTNIVPTRTVPISTYSKTSTAFNVYRSTEDGYNVWDVRLGKRRPYLPDFGNPPPWGVRPPQMGRTYRVVDVIHDGRRYKTDDGSIWAIQSPYHKDARRKIDHGTLIYPVALDTEYLTAVIATGPDEESAMVAWIER
jgi:hypothetical protein